MTGTGRAAQGRSRPHRGRPHADGGAAAEQGDQDAVEDRACSGAQHWPVPGREADLPTTAGIYFTRRGEHLAQPLESIPAVVFSGVTRDLDPVVTVARADGMDPEATTSTTQMRATLIKETAPAQAPP